MATSWKERGRELLQGPPQEVRLYLLVVVHHTGDLLGVASEGGNDLFGIFLKDDCILVSTSSEGPRCVF